jgi:hypothetical protein
MSSKMRARNSFSPALFRRECQTWYKWCNQKASNSSQSPPVAAAARDVHDTSSSQETVKKRGASCCWAGVVSEWQQIGKSKKKRENYMWTRTIYISLFFSKYTMIWGNDEMQDDRITGLPSQGYHRMGNHRMHNRIHRLISWLSPLLLSAQVWQSEWDLHHQQSVRMERVNKLLINHLS